MKRTEIKFNNCSFNGLSSKYEYCIFNFKITNFKNSTFAIRKQKIKNYEQRKKGKKTTLQNDITSITICLLYTRMYVLHFFRIHKYLF